MTRKARRYDAPPLPDPAMPPRYPAPNPAAVAADGDPRVIGLSDATVSSLRQAADAMRGGALDSARAALDHAWTLAPAHPETLRLRAVLALRQQRWQDARNDVRAALTQWPDDALLLSDLGNALAASGDSDGAIAHWRRACARDTTLAMAWFNLGRALQLRGDTADAKTALEAAVATAPAFVPAHILLGDACAHLGQFDLASARYRAALVLEPNCGDAWRGLANIKTRAIDADDRERMRLALAQPDLRDDDRIAIGHALGKACEDAGDYPAAFAALQAANAVQHRRAPWQEAALRDHVDQILTRTRNLPKAPNPRFGHEAIFIVGLPRTGSTLLEQMLSSHPDVEGASELADLDAVLMGESQRRGLPWPHWLDKATAQDWLRLGRDYLKRTQRWRDRKPRHTDKLPENWRFVGVLRAMLPGAHIIDMRRDPLETAWSCYKQQFYQRPHFACDFEDIAAYRHHCERALDLWRARDPEHIHVQHYEHLIADPERALRDLLAALDLRFAPECLDHARTQRAVRTASAAQVREPLRTDTARSAHYGTLLDPLRAALARPR